MVPKNQALLAIDVARKDMESLSSHPANEYLLSVVELFEIIDSAIPLLYDQSPAPSNFSERVGLLQSERSREVHEIALHFDSTLSKWEQGLPSYLQPGASHSSEDELYQKQGIALRLR